MKKGHDCSYRNEREAIINELKNDFFHREENFFYSNFFDK